jgi:hypothetical protein
VGTVVLSKNGWVAVRKDCPMKNLKLAMVGVGLILSVIAVAFAQENGQMVKVPVARW